MNKRNFIKDRSRGFTLVELIIVIVIIAILAGLTIVGYGNITKTAAKTSVKNDLTQAAKELEVIRTANKSKNYPTTFPDEVKTSEYVGLALTQTDANKFCINGTHKNHKDIRVSYDSDNGFTEGFCSGEIIVTIGDYVFPNEPTYSTHSVYDNTALTGSGGPTPSAYFGAPLTVAQRFSFTASSDINSVGARIFLPTGHSWIGQNVSMGVHDDITPATIATVLDGTWNRSENKTLSQGWNEVTWTTPLGVSDGDIWVIIKNSVNAGIRYLNDVSTDLQALDGSDLWLSATWRADGNTVWYYWSGEDGVMYPEIVNHRFGIDVLMSLPD